MASKKNERKRIKAKAAMKAAMKAAPSGSEYPEGKFGGGKVTDKGIKRR